MSFRGPIGTSRTRDAKPSNPATSAAPDLYIKAPAIGFLLGLGPLAS
jgi:hypothetical protein